MKIGTIYDITFSTNRADTGALANADSTPIVRVTENGVNLAYTPTVSSLTTGVYLVTIDASLANGFEVGKRYSVYVTATVNSIDGANGLDSFTMETRSIDDIPTSSEITDAVWDEPLTGATHNIPTSAGRRLRQLGQIVIYDGIAQGSGTGDNQIQLDTGASSTNGAYDPSEIAIISGTGAGQSRLIIQYAGATRMATVDRNWRVIPDATSEFIIYVNSGREHVNEGLAQGGTPSTITLNTNASSADGTYIGQTIFLRSGTGEDQVARVTEYNGTTKVATISTSMAGNTWSVTPDTTTGYVMIPNYHIESGGGGGLTTEQDEKLTRIDERVDTPVSEIAVGWNPYIEGVNGLKKGIQKIVDKVESKGEEVKTKIEDEVKTIVIPEQKEPVVNVTTEKIDTKEFLKAIKEIKPEVNITTETVNNEPILTAIKEIGKVSEIKIPEYKEPKEVDLGPIQEALNEVKSKIDEDSIKIDIIEDYIEDKKEEHKKKMEEEAKKDKEMEEEENMRRPIPSSFIATLK